MLPEPFTCDLDSETKATLKVYLFKNVKNANTIKDNVVKGVWKCAIIKPSLVVDLFQIAVAANKAVVAEKCKSMVTRSIFTEVIYNLSLTKSITKSLNQFGIDNDESLLMCFVIRPTDNFSTDIIYQVEGEMCPINELGNFTNMKDVQNMYKLHKLNLSDDDLLDVIICRMLCKSFVSPLTY